MRILTLAILISAISFAAEEPKKEQAPAPLSNEEKLTIENLQLRMQILQLQSQQVYATICSTRDLNLMACQVDAAKGTVQKVQQPAPEKK